MGLHHVLNGDGGGSAVVERTVIGCQDSAGDCLNIVGAVIGFRHNDSLLFTYPVW